MKTLLILLLFVSAAHAEPSPAPSLLPIRDPWSLVQTTSNGALLVKGITKLVNGLPEISDGAKLVIQDEKTKRRYFISMDKPPKKKGKSKTGCYQLQMSYDMKNWTTLDQMAPHYRLVDAHDVIHTIEQICPDN